MGLDNGFILRSNKSEEVQAEVAYFRKYYELDDWILSHCHDTYQDYKYERIVTRTDLEALLKEIEPIAEELNKYTYNQLSFYDDNEYPQEIREKFYNDDFAPFDTRSFAAGNKLVKLYRNILNMIEILEHNHDKDLFLTFYSSF